MIIKEWLHGYKEVTPEQIKKMEPGATIIIHGADRHGEHYTIETKIVYCGKKKVLTYWAGVDRMRLPIQSNPRWVYTLERGKE